jgi:hypothetical protein
MNTTIWIIQGLMAAFFLLPGIAKAFFSKEKLTKMNILEPGKPVMEKRVIGILELMGVIGIIVPLLIGVMPILTPIAAIGLSLTMAGAILVHLKKKEYKTLPLLALVGLLGIVVAWYRFQTV